MYEEAKIALANCIGRLKQRRATGYDDDAVERAKDLVVFWKLKVNEIELDALQFSAELDSGF